MDKKIYDVAQGVNWVNGEAVPKDRKVELTEVEALFDLSQGRITLAGAPTKTPAKAQS